MEIWLERLTLSPKECLKMIKELKDMTKKELKEELIGINEHIDNFSYGRFELNYREDILREMEKRK